MQDLIDTYSMSSPNRGKKLSKDEIVSRILFPLVNEGFKILEEGIATTPSDIDIIYLYGYGFPASKGMSFAAVGSRIPCSVRLSNSFCLQVALCFGQTTMQAYLTF
jgi:hypothetical protein